jgi:hypothetical protein
MSFDPFDLFGEADEVEEPKIDPMTLLTPHQLSSAELLLEYLQTNEEDYSFTVLKGYAGTGKSYTLSRVLEAFGGRDIGMSAPTHKAVRVLKQQSENPMAFTYGTIHSLLGLSQNISDKGVVSYTQSFPPKPRRIESLKVLIIDESSMLDIALTQQLLMYLKTRPSLKLIFCGDSLQCPPVGEKQSYVLGDKVLTEYKVLQLELNEPMRQSIDNPILGYATAIRSNIHTEVPYKDFLNSTSETGLEVVQTDSPGFADSILSFFNERFDENQDFMKVLAWTNRQVNRSNDMIRKHRLQEPFPDKIVQGEYLVADKPIFKLQGSRKVTIINTSEEMRVTKVTQKTIKVPWNIYFSGAEMEESAGHKNLDMIKQHQRISHDFKVYHCVVEVEKDEALYNYEIFILHEDEEEYYNQIVLALKTAALKAFNRKAAWREFYDFQSIFAAVKYNYALTVHKS